MKGLVRTLFVSMLLLVGAATASPAAADNPHTTTPGLPLQLALGDSWPAGAGASKPSEGYVPQLHEALQEGLNCSEAGPDQAKAGCPQLELLNIAEGGETTPSMIEEQFPVAIPLLEARNRNLNPRDDVEVITVHIGGNDIFRPIIENCQGGLTLACQVAIQTALNAYGANLGSALSTLRNEAGNDTTIVIGTYDNPFRFTPCVLVSGIQGVSVLADFVLEGDPGSAGFEGLHDRMRTVAALTNVQAEVADVYGDLNSRGDWFSSQQIDQGLPPTDCLHPTDSGYDKVTDAFLEAL
jgi:lysophospholipase L1-like esterase